MHRCPNRACPSRGLETLIHWVSAAMDIEGVGEQFVRRLWDEGLLRSMPDLYRLTPEQLQELDGYGEISARRAVDSIEASKAQPFSRVLFGLNIPKIGWVLARNLARDFGSVDALDRGEPGGARAGRGHRPRPRRARRRVVRGGGEPRARRGAALARPDDDRRRGGAARRGAADRAPVRHHRDARAVHARGGEGGARGARREGLGLRVEEDDGRDRRARAPARSSPRRRRRACLSSTRTPSRAARPLRATGVAAVRCWALPRERGDEAVLRAPRGPEGDRGPVLEHGEDDVAADQPGERAGEVRRARLAADDAREVPAAGPRACRSGPRRRSDARNDGPDPRVRRCPPRSTPTSARAVSRSSDESPEPSTIRTPVRRDAGRAHRRDARPGRRRRSSRRRRRASRAA